MVDAGERGDHRGVDDAGWRTAMFVGVLQAHSPMTGKRLRALIRRLFEPLRTFRLQAREVLRYFHDRGEHYVPRRIQVVS